MRVTTNDLGRREIAINQIHKALSRSLFLSRMIEPFKGDSSQRTPSPTIGSDGIMTSSNQATYTHQHDKLDDSTGSHNDSHNHSASEGIVAQMTFATNVRRANYIKSNNGNIHDNSNYRENNSNLKRVNRDDSVAGHSDSDFGDWLYSCDCDDDECGIRRRGRRRPPPTFPQGGGDDVTIPNSIRLALELYERQRTSTIRRRQQRELVQYVTKQVGTPHCTDDYPLAPSPGSLEWKFSLWQWTIPSQAEPLLEFGDSHRLVYVQRLQGTVQRIGSGIVGSQAEESTREVIPWKASHAYFIPSRQGKAVGWIYTSATTTTAMKSTRSSTESFEIPLNEQQHEHRHDNGPAVWYIFKIPPEALDFYSNVRYANNNNTNECDKNYIINDGNARNVGDGDEFKAILPRHAIDWAELVLPIAQRAWLLLTKDRQGSPPKDIRNDNDSNYDEGDTHAMISSEDILTSIVLSANDAAILRSICCEMALQSDV